MQNRPNRVVWVGAAAVLLLGAMLVASVWMAPRRQSVELPDGSVVSLERVEVEQGQPRRNTPGLSFLRHVIGQILGRPSFNRNHYRDGAMIVWLSRRDKATGTPKELGLGSAVAVDEHGCEFRVRDWWVQGRNFTSSGNPPRPPTGMPPSKFLIYSGVLETFPTRQKSFELRLFDETGKLTATFDVPNLSQGPHPVWEPESLPATKTLFDGSTVTLQSLLNEFQIYEQNGMQWEGVRPVPSFRFERNGQSVDDWTMHSMEVTDATGRWAQWQNGGVCSHESAWKLLAQFRRQPHATFASNETWHVTGLDIAAPGQSIPNTNTTVVTPGASNNVTLRLCAVTGPAAVTYSNGVPVKVASTKYQHNGHSYSWSSRSMGRNQQVEITIDSSAPHVLLDIGEGNHDLIVSVLTKDNVREKFVPGMTQSSSGGYKMFRLDLATNATTFDLQVVAQQPQLVEFIVPPPPPPAEITELSPQDLERVRREIPARDPTAGPELIDLNEHYNAPIRTRRGSAGGPVVNGSATRGYSFSDLSPGVHRLGNIEFDVRGAVQASGLSLKNQNERFPKRIEGIPIDRQARRLHFLAGTIWPVHDGTEIGQIIVRFKNEKTSVRPIIYGRDVLDWCTTQYDTSSASALPVWEPGGNGPQYRSSDQGRLFALTWENPDPEAVVASVDFISNDTSSAPFLIAITAEPK